MPKSIDEYVAEVVAKAPTAAAGNPFGRWTKHRATIAALNRSDARNLELEAESRRLLVAARLADKIMEVRGGLTADQRRVLANLLLETD